MNIKKAPLAVRIIGSISCFQLRHLSSFSAAFLTQTVCLDDTTVKFEIWDTAGQERVFIVLSF